MIVALYLLIKLFVWTAKAVVYMIVFAVVAVFTVGYVLVLGAIALFHLVTYLYWKHQMTKATRIMAEEATSPAAYSDCR